MTDTAVTAPALSQFLSTSTSQPTQQVTLDSLNFAESLPNLAMIANAFAIDWPDIGELLDGGGWSGGGGGKSH